MNNIYIGRDVLDGRVVCVKRSGARTDGRPPWESLETLRRGEPRPSTHTHTMMGSSYARAHGSCRLISPTHYHFFSLFLIFILLNYFVCWAEIGSLFPPWNFILFLPVSPCFFFFFKCYCSTISFAYAMSVQIVPFHLSVNSNKFLRISCTYRELNTRSFGFEEF
jgi:hypothetical protein